MVSPLRRVFERGRRAPALYYPTFPGVTDVLGRLRNAGPLACWCRTGVGGPQGHRDLAPQARVAALPVGLAARRACPVTFSCALVPGDCRLPGLRRRDAVHVPVGGGRRGARRLGGHRDVRVPGRPAGGRCVGSARGCVPVGVSEILARYAVQRAHVLVVEVPGCWSLRVALERQVLSRGWQLAESPADADVLVVCGQPGPELGELVDRVWDQLPGPRVRLGLPRIEALDGALDAIQAVWSTPRTTVRTPDSGQPRRAWTTATWTTATWTTATWT